VSSFRFLLLPALVVLAAGCQASPETQPLVPDDDGDEVAIIEEPEFIPELVPGGSAAENQPYVNYLVGEKVTQVGESVTGREVVDLLLEAGFEPDHIEFTPDTSLIQLPADSVTVAIRIEEECIIAQWGSDWYASSVEPVLVTETCLLGATKSLD
jgi:hypothetical protein